MREIHKLENKSAMLRRTYYKSADRPLFVRSTIAQRVRGGATKSHDMPVHNDIP
jgi:hypothetical protein